MWLGNRHLTDWVGIIERTISVSRTTFKWLMCFAQRKDSIMKVHAGHIFVTRRMGKYEVPGQEVVMCAFPYNIF